MISVVKNDSSHVECLHACTVDMNEETEGISCNYTLEMMYIEQSLYIGEYVFMCIHTYVH